MKRLTSLILAFNLIVFALAGCGSSASANRASNPYAYGADLQGEGGSPLYERKSIELPDSNVRLDKAAKAGDYILLFGISSVDEQVYFYRLNIADDTVTRMNYSTKQNMIAFDGSSDGSMTLITCVGEETDTKYTIIEVDLEDAVSETVFQPISDLSSTSVEKVQTTEAGYLVATSDSVLLINKDGELVRTYGKYDKPPALVESASGKTLICSSDAEGVGVEELGSDMSVVSKYTFQEPYILFFDGAGSSSLFAADISNIYSVDYETGEKKALANILANGMTTSSFIYLSDGRFFTIHEGKPTIWSPQDDTDPVVTIKFATYDISPYLYSAIYQFNEANDHYKIDVTDYATYNTVENSNAGLTRLNSEIISGNFPDIFDLSMLPSDIYISLTVCLQTLSLFLIGTRIFPVAISFQA